MTSLAFAAKAAQSLSILSVEQADALRGALQGRHIAVCFGAGVDSTAMLVALRAAGIRPDVITFADTGAEKPETHAHVTAMNRVLCDWGWPAVHVCKKKTLPSTGYSDLYGNCIANETLPSLAFGMKSCSIKWKQDPQDKLLKGAKSGPSKRPPHPLWLASVASGQRIVKLIGYDCGKADLRRSRNLKDTDGEFDFCYPLQIIGWARRECVQAITRMLGADLVPIKSACFFCPASKHWELYWLAAYHPDLLERALVLERTALTGRHSRFDAVEFGASWEELVRSPGGFPSTKTSVGLGRGFSWNQWAFANRVVDESFRVFRDEASRLRFAQASEAMRGSDNALDGRSNLIPVKTIQAEQLKLAI